MVVTTQRDAKGCAKWYYFVVAHGRHHMEKVVTL